MSDACPQSRRVGRNGREGWLEVAACKRYDGEKSDLFRCPWPKPGVIYRYTTRGRVRRDGEGEDSERQV